MKMLIDTNVIMDALVGREPFLAKSEFVVNLCGERLIHGYIAAHTVTNLFYLLRKYYPSDQCKAMLLATLNLFEVIQIDRDKLIPALQNESFKDFEDCLQMECGKMAKVNYIVTRDMKDFANSDIPCLTPDEVYAMFSSELR